MMTNEEIQNELFQLPFDISDARWNLKWEEEKPLRGIRTSKRKLQHAKAVLNRLEKRLAELKKMISEWDMLLKKFNLE